MPTSAPQSYSIKALLQNVLESEKFEPTIRNGEKGYLDKQEKVFVPKKVIPALIREFTVGPSIIRGANRFDGYFALSQIRTKRRLAQGLRGNIKVRSYNQVLLRYISNEFLKMFADSKLNFAALYVDIVGSTVLSMNVSPEKLSTLISIFIQEMAALVPMHGGFVLKYAGDSVIAFFPEIERFSMMCHDALECGRSMRDLLQFAVNSVLIQFSLEPLKIRIGIEAGVNQVVQIGGDIDIIGPTMNMSCKVTSTAAPDGICIGEIAYEALDDRLKKNFVPVELDSSNWKFHDPNGKMYRVYKYMEERDSEIVKVDTNYETRDKDKSILDNGNDAPNSVDLSS